jgi:hypothetical protein
LAALEFGEFPMAQSAGVANETVEIWESLEEVRNYALVQGCTEGQFSDALAAVGPNPLAVASYLQRHGFTKHGFQA